jgi:23S rRNA pseudouridine2605 synthase
VPPEGAPDADREGGEGERLQKLLARAGLGSRRACEGLIAAGRVTVDDQVAVLGTRADPGRSRIALDGVPVVVDTTRVYWLLNKPAGYVTTAHDPQGRRTVMELVPPEPRTFAVGRLDRDTEGLLLMTNDGELAEFLTHPRHGVEKAYLAEVQGIPSPAAMRAMREGLQLDDGPAKAVRAQVVQRSNNGDSALEIVMNEGRKRIVRRMCAEIGHPVQRLVRTRIGRLTDQKLAPGTHRPLTAAEVRGLYEAALVGHVGAGRAGSQSRRRGA